MPLLLVHCGIITKIIFTVTQEVSIKTLEIVEIVNIQYWCIWINRYLPTYYKLIDFS